MSRTKGMRHARKKTGFWAVVWSNRSLGAKIAIAAAAVLLSLIILFSAAVHIVTGRPIWTWIDTLLFVSENYNQDDDFSDLSNEDLGIVSDPEIHFPEGITNIALFGIDARSDGMKGLSDSIMIISVDAVNNKIKLISIVRDSLVKVDGHGYQKINAAYNLGGAPLAVKTLNQVYKLNITNYATVDFVGMSQIIEAVGGIDTVMTKYEVENANIQINEMHLSRGTPLDYIQSSGQVHLNGIQAVAYSRVRYADVHKDIAGDEWGWGDYGRTLRQRYVMNQLFQKALTLKLDQYPEFIEALLPLVKTSLTYSDIYDLAMILLKDGVSMQQARIPVDAAVIDSGLNVKGLGSCVYYNLDYASELIRAFLFEDTSFETYIEQNGINRRGWLPSSMIVTTPGSNTSGSAGGDGGHTSDGPGPADTLVTGAPGTGGGGTGSEGGTTDTTDVTDGTDSTGSTGTDSGTVTDSGSSDSGTVTDSDSGGTSSAESSTDTSSDTSASSGSQKPPKPENSSSGTPEGGEGE